MQLQQGGCIASTSEMTDPNFSNAVILITEYNTEGAIGYVINKLFSRKLNELAELSHSIPFNIFDGGPVDHEHLYFLHKRPDLIEDSSKIIDGIYLGGNFKQAVEGINNGSITPGQLKILIGYCGWNAGELEAEIEEGSWVILSETEYMGIWQV